MPCRISRSVDMTVISRSTRPKSTAIGAVHMLERPPEPACLSCEMLINSAWRGSGGGQWGVGGGRLIRIERRGGEASHVWLEGRCLVCACVRARAGVCVCVWVRVGACMCGRVELDSTRFSAVRKLGEARMRSSSSVSAARRSALLTLRESCRTAVRYLASRVG